MIHELEKIKWDIVGLAETKVKKSQISVHETSGHKLFFSSNEISPSNGVGFLVNKSCVPMIEDYYSISDRRVVISLKGRFSKLFFIQCNFPTSSHPVEKVEELYEKIQTLVDRISQRDYLFIKKDFKCKVVQLHTFLSAIGKYTLSKANSRGERRGQFCVQNNLQITNTMFQKKDKFFSLGHHLMEIAEIRLTLLFLVSLRQD